jgi:hypothetical protein
MNIEDERAAVHGQIQYLGHRLDEHDRMLEEMPKALRSALADALRDVLGDKELRSEFWKAGYEELSSHASNGASQWVGKRILIAAVTAVFVLSLGWLVKNGWIR